ncbi:uncharacterized protein EV420DRAFT_1275013 [Desarmillaria tabescens]|uniref:DUF1275 domain protein n=1 Tax=Armillaria tabescens TaxID=1929756 RepID=A0AA39JZY5_ARMTA|nr:uncharacterized protein EV420DRAFT_1275013 [Desarmillaria tabescens]KAK0449698.1 hypothetical protein EV420DRAFT_1275013 [Desarmillaria tabescens]
MHKAGTFSTVDAEGGIATPKATSPSTFWTHLNEEVDPSQSVGPLAAFCFMTGYIDVISFSAIFVWCGFQTGNFAQLAIALARLFETRPEGSGHDTSFHMPDKQALTSLIAFNLGALVGRLGDRIGPHKRVWLIFGTFLQALLTMAASATIYKSNMRSIADERADPSWTNVLAFACIAFMSASLGVQGILGKRLNTQFTTTIVLTTVWVELVTDPQLFNFRKMIKSRDHKLIAASSLFVGAFAGRAILGAIGAPAALGIGTGIRVLITLSWIFVPSKARR